MEKGMAILLNNEDVRNLLDMESCVTLLEEAYRDLGENQAVNRPKTYVVVPEEPELSYSYCTMEGASRRLGVVAIRMKSDMNRYVEVFGMGRHEKWASPPGLFCGLVLLFSSHNGELLAILNDGLIQQMRVGATSGVAAKYLAREDASVLGMIGSGGQARSHARAFAAVRKLKRLKVYSPNPERRRAYASEMAEALEVDVMEAENAEAAVEGADIVATCTNSIEPVIRGEWLPRGSHATSVNTSHELDDDFFKHVDVIVRHQILDTKRYTAGSREEIEHAPKATRKRRIDISSDLPTLADLVWRKIPGRTRREQVTYFNNNEGNGLQFAVCAGLAHKRALEKGAGREIPTDWFLQDIRD
jgi:alanine dehydrogenase